MRHLFGCVECIIIYIICMRKIQKRRKEGQTYSHERDTKGESYRSLFIMWCLVVVCMSACMFARAVGVACVFVCVCYDLFLLCVFTFTSSSMP